MNSRFRFAVAGAVLGLVAAAAVPAAAVTPVPHPATAAPGLVDHVRVRSVVAEPSSTAAGAAVVSVRRANLRLHPSASSRRVASLRRGTHVAILDQSGEWLHVRAGHRTGYILGRLVR